MKSRFLRRIALAMLFAPFLATPMSLFAWQKNPDKGSGEPKELSRVVVQKLENVVIPALQSGDEGRFMEAFMEIIQRAETDDFEAIENFGIEFGIPSLKKEFGSRFLNIVEQKTVPQNSSFQLSTVLYLNQHFLDRVDGDLRELDAHPVMNEPLELPADWNGNEKLFWEVHVFDNQLANLQQLTAYFVQLNKPFFERATKKKETATIDAIQPVGEVPDRLLAAMVKMNENQAELRLVELELAEKTMRESKDFEERLSAAFAMELDIGRLNEFFEKTPAATITRPKLVNPNVKETIKSLIASARLNGKDVIEKALRLRIGAHWWLRGRYGASTEAFGLLKPIEAMRDESVMFGLYMPKQWPQPIGWRTDESDVSPGYDRRHYYTWAIEYRELITNMGEIVTGMSPSRTTRRAAGSEFW